MDTNLPNKNAIVSSEQPNNMDTKLPKSFSLFFRFFQKFSLFIPHNFLKKLTNLHLTAGFNFILIAFQFILLRIYNSTPDSFDSVGFTLYTFEVLSTLVLHFIMTSETVFNGKIQYKINELIKKICVANDLIRHSSCNCHSSLYTAEDMGNDNTFHRKYLMKFMISTFIGVSIESSIISYAYNEAPYWSECYLFRWWSLNIVRFGVFHWLLYIDWLTGQLANISIRLDVLATVQ